MPGTMAAAIKTDENPLPQPLSPSITISSGPHTITAAAAMVMKTTHKPPQPAPALPTKLSFSPFSDMSDLSDMSDASTSSDDDDNSAIISDGALSGDDADEQLDAANNPNSAVGPSKASTPIKITRTSSRSTRSPVQSPAEDLPHSKPSVSPSLRGRGAGKSRRGGRGRAKAKATNEYQRKRKKEVKGTAEPVPALTHIEEALTRPEAYRADPDGVYCVCRSGYDGSEFMVLCDICLEWFHGRCINLTNTDVSEHYFCGPCELKHPLKPQPPTTVGPIPASAGIAPHINGIGAIDAGKGKRGAGRGRGGARRNTGTTILPAIAETLLQAGRDLDTDDDKDDDICPVCESECTCSTAARQGMNSISMFGSGRGRMNETKTHGQVSDREASRLEEEMSSQSEDADESDGESENEDKVDSAVSALFERDSTFTEGIETPAASETTPACQWRTKGERVGDTVTGADIPSPGSSKVVTRVDSSYSDDGDTHIPIIGVPTAHKPSTGRGRGRRRGISERGGRGGGRSRVSGRGRQRGGRGGSVVVHSDLGGMVIVESGARERGGENTMVEVESGDEDEEMIDPEALDALVDDLSSLSSRAGGSEVGDKGKKEEEEEEEEEGEKGEDEDEDEDSSSTSSDSSSEEEEIDFVDNEELEEEEEWYLVERMRIEEREAIQRVMEMCGHDRTFFGIAEEEMEEDEYEEAPRGSWSSTEDDDDEIEEIGIESEDEEDGLYDELRDVEFSFFPRGDRIPSLTTQDTSELVIGNGIGLATLMLTQEQLHEALGLGLSALALPSLAAPVEQEGVKADEAAAMQVEQQPENMVTVPDATTTAAVALTSSTLQSSLSPTTTGSLSIPTSSSTAAISTTPPQLKKLAPIPPLANLSSVTTAGPTSYLTTVAKGTRQILPRLTSVASAGATMIAAAGSAPTPGKTRRSLAQGSKLGAIKEVVEKIGATVKKDTVITPVALMEKEKVVAEAEGEVGGTGKKRKGDESTGIPKRRRSAPSKASMAATTVTLTLPTSPLLPSPSTPPPPSLEPEPTPIPIDEVVDTTQLTQSSSRSPSPPQSPVILQWDEKPGIISSFRRSRRASAPHVPYTTSTALKSASKDEVGSTLLCDVKRIQPTSAFIAARGRRHPQTMQELYILSPVLTNTPVPAASSSSLKLGLSHGVAGTRSAQAPAPAMSSEMEDMDNIPSLFIPPQTVVNDMMDANQPPSSACSTPLYSPLFSESGHGNMVVPELNLDEECSTVGRMNGNRGAWSVAGAAGLKPGSLLGIRRTRR